MDIITLYAIYAESGHGTTFCLAGGFGTEAEAEKFAESIGCNGYFVDENGFAWDMYIDTYNEHQ